MAALKIGQIAKWTLSMGSTAVTKSKRTSGRVSIIRWIVASLALLLAIPVTSQAEILEATLQVNGMSCPFCAFGIEKKLRSVDGVQEVDVLLDEGRQQSDGQTEERRNRPRSPRVLRKH